MASSSMVKLDRHDWVLANPWAWTVLGLAICLLNWLTVLVLGESLNGIGLGLVFLGLLAAFAGVALRLNSSAPPFLDSLAPRFRTMVVLGLACLFALIALTTTALVLLRMFEVNPLHLRLNSLIILWAIVGPMSLTAALTALRRARPGTTITPAAECAAVLALAALATFCAARALYNSDSPTDWDSLRLFLAALFVVVLGAAPLILVAQATRRLVVSVLIVLHFGGISMAALSPPPAPWIVQQIWFRVYQPYLEFMYLNNAYHFYAPEPGPASFLWFRMFYEDPQGKLYAHWEKIPDVDDKGWHKNKLALEYQRILAVTENVTFTDISPSMTFTRADGSVVYADWYVRRVEHSPNQAAPNIGQPDLAKDALIIPFHPIVPLNQQYLQPNANSRALLASYARHMCRQPHPEHPDWKLKSVKIYRVVHSIPDMYYFAYERFDPRDPFNYKPYYMGHYNPKGELLDLNEYDVRGNLIKAGDPFLFWLLPNLRDPPANKIESTIRCWVARHAGDPDWVLTYDETEKRHLPENRNQSQKKVPTP